MIRLSIIIPFYNVEQYIAQCLDSVYQQNIPEEEYEVICVNDASPDGSREVVKEYQKKHKNLILVEHEVNKKLGAARNTGRRVAKGSYIWNVDSDDMIAPNCLKGMLATCEKNELDVLMFGVRRLYEGKLYEREHKVWNETQHVETGLDFWRTQGAVNRKYISSVWTQVYSKDFLDENQIYSPEINMGEDVPFTFYSMLSAKRMLAINESFYVYRDNAASLTGALRKHPNPKAVYENSFVCGAYMYHIQKEFQKRDQHVCQTLKPITRYIVLLYTYYAKLLTSDEKQIFLSLCRKNFLKNLFVYRILGMAPRWEYTKYILTGTIPEYR